MSASASPNTSLPTVLIISQDIIGQRMAGPGIRAWEMARVLAAQQPVMLLAPQPIDLDTRHLPRLTCGSFAPDDSASLTPWLAAAGVVVTNGYMLRAHPALARLPQPLVLDLYDPVLLENLELFRHAPAAQRATQYTYDHATLTQQLALGDFFLCATERQRDLYIGALLGQGRITPAVTDSDPQLRGLIDVVGFGLSAEPPVKQQPALRGVLPGITADDIILLWTGGMWDWLDPLTLVRAMPPVVAAAPHVRLVFLAGQHPGSARPLPQVQAAQQLAAELELLDQHIFFYTEWIPYQQRADFLLEADIAVSLHRNHLETTYAAVRSRFLDHLWAGLPSIVSAGDAAADLVRTAKLGYTVEPEDSKTTAEAVGQLVHDHTQRQQCAANARHTAQLFTWERTLAPLVRFCRAPVVQVARGQALAAAAPPAQSRAPDTADAPAAATAPAPTQDTEDRAAMQQEEQQEQQRLVAQIEQLWQLGATPPQGSAISRIAQRVFLRMLAPLIAQQRDFNATAVKLFYVQRAQSEQTATALNAVMAQTVALQRDLHSRLDTIAGFTGEISARIDRLQRDLHGRLDTIAEFDHDLNDRLARLVHTVQMLDDAVAAADEASAALAGQLALLPVSSTPDRSGDADPGRSNPS